MHRASQLLSRRSVLRHQRHFRARANASAILTTPAQPQPRHLPTMAAEISGVQPPGDVDGARALFAAQQAAPADDIAGNGAASPVRDGSNGASTPDEDSSSGAVEAAAVYTTRSLLHSCFVQKGGRLSRTLHGQLVHACRTNTTQPL